jgi:hypothetical protein
MIDGGAFIRLLRPGRGQVLGSGAFTDTFGRTAAEVVATSRVSWWAAVRWSRSVPLGMRVFVECSLCGASAYGLTRRLATRAVLAWHTPGATDCQSAAAELARDGDFQAAALAGYETRDRSELEQALHQARDAEHRATAGSEQELPGHAADGGAR